MRTRSTLVIGVALGAAVTLGARELPAAWDELMGTRVVKAAELRPVTGAQGTIRTYFDAPTSTLLNLGMRTTTLDPGDTPHPTRPYSRAIEGIILVQEGTLEVQLDAQNGGRTERLDPGSAIFLAPNQWHSLRNTGTGPVTFVELQWTSPGMNGEPSYPQVDVNWRRPR